jgi:hypothetical protein
VLSNPAMGFSRKVVGCGEADYQASMRSKLGGCWRLDVLRSGLRRRNTPRRCIRG